MIEIKFVPVGDDGHRIPTYPGCPYSGDTSIYAVCFGLAMCNHKKSKFGLCFTNHLKPITCPFNIHEELGGI
jgi:hypothetical protein